MNSLVQLYVYDLSNGLARQLSLQLTGKQIDGIWHSSVVVFGKEIFYGQGISITAPGQSHHGRPLQVIEVGETALDEDTLEEYLTEMREHYTADKAKFNCNSFTNDCVGFLTGGSIPSWIKDLPTDFLSTPFGAALRPTIDAMYRRPAAPVPAMTPPSAQTAEANPQLASALLQAIAERAASGAPIASGSGTGTPSTSTVTAPIHVSTNLASFHSTLESHRAVVAFFTSSTCAPCRMIEPVFDELAQSRNKGEGKIAFVKIDTGVGMGAAVAAEYRVNATPTFNFFLDGKRVHELKGVNAPELRTQVDLLLYQAFPPHPHASLDLPAIRAISLEPILFTQVPALETVRDKLFSFIDAAPSDTFTNKSTVKGSLTNVIFPWLKSRFSNDKQPSSPQPPSSLCSTFGDWRSSTPASLKPPSPPSPFLLTTVSASASPVPRPTLLTLLRLLSNALSSPLLARGLLAADLQAKSVVTEMLVQMILHEDRLVRVASASVAFNIAAWVQRGRAARLRRDEGKADEGIREGEEDEEWEIEMVSAVVEALDREKESEEVVHRLTATLALFLQLSPFYEGQLVPLLEVLQAQTKLKAKLAGEGGLNIQKKEARSLLQEVADKLCA
ncbi:hypothetical protein EW146_g9529 [Bondarzewia mesenterica]|uniref:PPPDE domain-containing protein n=1 Tax=Bondarzewia mesenterica TaxID=1095465 RepID=A0A4S4L5Y4_9AGAM|nr:hypothetical protein EW146_g9529 [Bondarzewia mesenterica]